MLGRLLQCNQARVPELIEIHAGAQSPRNGKNLAWSEIHFLRIADGQIVEHWTNFDQLGILRQLGAIP